MRKKIIFILFLSIFAYLYYIHSNRYIFNYSFLDNQTSREIDEQQFLKDKNSLIAKIISSSNNPTGQYTLNHREYLQAYQCNVILNIIGPDDLPIKHHKKYYREHPVSESSKFKNLDNRQKSTALEYITQCLNLIDEDETYQEMLIRLRKKLNTQPNNKEGVELKKLYDLNRDVAQEQHFDDSLIKNAHKQLKSKNITNKDKSKYWRLIRQSENNIKQINQKFQNRYLNLLKQSSSPDVVFNILYNYKKRLPESWKENLIKNLSGLPSNELNNKLDNRYFDYLIHPSIDLYLCSIGYPCDKQAYYMYFQCLGFKYKANSKACNEPVYSYYLSDFLTENMQYDVLKIIKYIAESRK